MELVKNIFFNTDKLTQNSTVKISYTGKLFQDDSNEVYIHYGFGLLWENLNEVKMEKTDLGFQAEIELSDKETFNFCFKNELNQWDNNDGNNYIFELEEVTTDLVSVDGVESVINTNHEKFFKKIGKKIRQLPPKIKLAVYKLITSVPKLISGTYKHKRTEEN